MLHGPSTGALEVRSGPVGRDDALLDLLPAADPLVWVQDGEGMVGWGEAARIELKGPDRFAAAQEWWDGVVARATVSDDVRVPGSGLVAFGSFAFDPDAASSVLVVPEVIVGRRGGVQWVTTVDGADPATRTTAPPAAPAGLRFLDDADADGAWMATVADARARIGSGALSKVVLARSVEAVVDEPLDVRWALARLSRDYPACWTFSVDGLIGATPEMLVRLRDGVATSRVLAGTLRRSGDATMDRRKGRALGRSIKDVEEHGYGVRSVADALALHCESVDVPADPFVLELPNVMHLASDVRGVVTDGSTSLGLVASLHPSAAVCGTPTNSAFALIGEIEGLERARYAGPVGWIDATGDGEWGIALRCAEVDRADGRRLRLFAGCGIVVDSRPQDELAESDAKLLPMREALAG